jgi:NADPH:quinone reductase-like Zn-dependent oxidoreductase
MSTMQAVYFDTFGESPVLKVGTLPVPEPGADEVLINIRYTSVNPVDWKIRKGYLKDFLPHEFPIIPGWDAAGVVTAVGRSATRFKVGDEVYAYTRLPVVKQGTYAEYIALPEAAVALKPTSITLAAAAGIPLVGLTAWQALFDVAALKRGDTVLITGGAGGVGSLAIQFAKAVGARVITTASAANHAYLRGLGADVAIDYTATDVVAAVKAAAPQGVDVAFDCVGGKALDQAFQLVKSGGWLVSIVDTPDSVRAKALGLNSAYHFVAPNGDQLGSIATMIDAGRIVPPATTEKSVTAAAAAQDENAARHVRGKVVLKIDFN